MAPLVHPGGGHPAQHTRSIQQSNQHATLGSVRSAKQRLVLAACAADRSAGAGAGGHMFIFGLGYTALAIGNQLQKLGWTVSGTCRSEEKREVLCARGFQAHLFNPDDDVGLGNGGLAALQSADHLLSTVPPVADFSRDPIIVQHKQQLIAAAGRLSWVGYLSSTGVYGDYQGAWVDERSEARAASGSGGARAEAERSWQQLQQQYGLPLHVFRLGGAPTGIYGPSRSAMDAARKKAAPSASQERRARQRFTARCHVHDIWQAVHVSMQHPSPGAIYNVVDDDPAARAEVVQYARSLLDSCAVNRLTAESDPDASHGEQSSASGCTVDEVISPASPTYGVHTSSSETDEDRPRLSLPEKRVSNSKLKQELGVVLRFPSYREGLRAIHAGEQTPFN